MVNFDLRPDSNNMESSKFIVVIVVYKLKNKTKFDPHIASLPPCGYVCTFLLFGNKLSPSK